MKTEQWHPRSTIPEDGTEVLVQSVGGGEPDDSKVIFEGKASYKEFRMRGFIDPLSGTVAYPDSAHMSWVKSATGKCVAGRIVRWRYTDE